MFLHLKKTLPSQIIGISLYSQKHNNYDKTRNEFRSVG